ncbi:LPP20 family lipoprotein [Fuchsiella alkaliacetigena]|uniref:LPP20 family lipoprotein n=1 Tax=Fuchsiella alkaliacetigena TaxID=957042 RepID=UPI00200B4930|nr:hypothetical protein [Fuchsiella alkaliacetigena]MCK8826101.1 hypothetical protein [Fuchsiella alkaliacetigena]
MNKSFDFKILSALIIMLLLTSLLVVNTQALEPGEEGEIDWDEGVIIIEGFGAPPEDARGAQAQLLAQRAARADAYRNAAEFMEGVNVSSTTTVEEYVVTSDKIATEVEGLIEGAEVISVEYGPDDVCNLKLKVPLAGEQGLTSFLEGTAKEDAPAHPDREDEVTTHPEPDLEQYEEEDIEIEEEPAEEYTGLIIDTRGLEVNTALYPQVFDSAGHLLYGPTTVDLDEPSTSSLVAYSRSQTEAEEMGRVGDNPLVVEATSVVSGEEREPVDVILDKESAQYFLEADGNSGIVDQQAVAFIID